MKEAQLRRENEIYDEFQMSKTDFTVKPSFGQMHQSLKWFTIETPIMHFKQPRCSD